jgi:hypothetical protein
MLKNQAALRTAMTATATARWRKVRIVNLNSLPFDGIYGSEVTVVNLFLETRPQQKIGLSEWKNQDQ